MPSRQRSRKSARVAAQAVELAVATPYVVMHRLTRFALAGISPSARDRKEFHRMGAEKLATFYESWNAMLLALFRANLNFALSPLHHFWRSSGYLAGLGVIGAGLAPIHRRATANARRLRRRRIA